MLTEDELKAEVGKRLGITNGKFLDHLWGLIKTEYSEQDIEDACGNPKAGISDIFWDIEEQGWWPFENLKLRLNAWEEREEHKRDQGPLGVVNVKLTEHESGYVEFLSWHLAKRAEQLPEVQRYREEELGGRALSEKEALKYLRDWELEFQGLDKDPSSMTEPELEDAGYVLYSMSRGELLRRWAPSLAAAIGSYDEHLFPRDMELGLIDESTMALGSWRLASVDKRLGWEAGGGQPRLAQSWTDLWTLPPERPDLSNLGRWLATLYPWRPIDAVWFLLTGEPPEVAAIELSSDHQRNLFTLVFAPWISEETIRRAYRGAREHLGMGGYRPIEDKTVAALRFVYENTDRGSRKPVPWTRLMELWNREHPKERFPSMRAFRQACLRAEEWLGIRERTERVGKKVEDIEEWLG